MDKKRCKSLEAHRFTERDRKMVENEEYIHYLLNVKEQDGLIVISAAERKDILGGNMVPRYQHIIDYSGRDYITRDLHSEKAKWLTSPLMNTIQCYNWHVSTYDANVDLFESLVTLRKYFKGKDLSDSLVEIIKWQDGIIEDRRHAREEKELEPTKLMMEVVPELPENMDEFVETQVFWNNKYLIYDASGKRYRKAFCTHCRNHFELDTKKFVPHRWEMSKCPSCGEDVVLQSIGLWHEKEKCTSQWAVIQEVENMILLRIGTCHKYMTSEKNEHEITSFDVKYDYFENRRIFFSKEGTEIGDYEHGFYKTLHFPCWKPTEWHYNCEEAVLMADGVNEILSDTAWKYLGASNLQTAWRGYRIPILRMFKQFKDKPEMEYLTKCGYLNVLRQYVGINRYYGRYSGLYGTQILEKLQNLPKEYRKAIKVANRGIESIEFLESLKAMGTKVNYETIKTWLMAFDKELTLWNKIHEHKINPIRFARYAMKQKQSFAKDYLDYVNWCERLKYDLSDRYYSMPPKFTRAHDNALEAIKAIEDAELKKKLREFMEQFAKMVDESKMQMVADGLIIRLPVSMEEIKTEGEVLHHCVATYIKRVAAGETNILFVRKVEEPEMPYYTVEYKNGRVVQCRGLRNCDMTPKVKKFVRAFEETMREKAA